MDITNFPTTLTANPVVSAPAWNDTFSTNSTANYLDFRYSHFARLEVTNNKLNFIASAYPYGEWYGNLSIYTPPFLLLPLDASWNISIQTALPTPDPNAIYKGVGLGLTPENETYDIANMGATVYTLGLAQDDDPTTPGSYVFSSARKDWETDPIIGQTNTTTPNGVFLRLAYDSSTKILTASYDTNTVASTRNWRQLEQLSIDPADANSVAASLGLTSQSKIRVGLWADNYTTNSVPPDQIWLDTLSVQVAPLPPAPLANGLRGNLGQAFSFSPAWSNSPVSFAASNLPPGLTNNPSNGSISGTPTTAGYFRATQTASNSSGITTFIIPITIPGTNLTLPYSDSFTNTVLNRYMPLTNLASPSQLVITNGALRFISTQSDSDGSLAAWIPNVPLSLTNSWDVVVDVNMPAGWNTPYAGVGLTLFPFEDSGTVETTASLRRLNFKMARDTQDPTYNGNYFGRAAYTNDIEYLPFPFISSIAPAIVTGKQIGRAHV